MNVWTRILLVLASLAFIWCRVGWIDKITSAFIPAQRLITQTPRFPKHDIDSHHSGRASPAVFQIVAEMFDVRLQDSLLGIVSV